MKEMIARINREISFDRKEGMLEMLNLFYGTKFGLLKGRVVRFENPDASTAEKYAHAHDAYAEM